MRGRIEAAIQGKRWNFINSKDTIEYGVYMKQRGTKWYLTDYDDDNNTAVWSSKIMNAYCFGDEEEVIDFCELFLRDRDYNIQVIL